MSNNNMDKFTLVISTYARDQMLLLHLSHWVECKQNFGTIHEIHVVFHNPYRYPSIELQRFSKKNDVIMRLQKTNKLSNRYNIPEGGFETDGIFSVDDDFVIDCRLLNEAFYYWTHNTTSSTRSIVGFEPRMIKFSQHSSIVPYDWNQACITCSYNIIFITKGAFLHKKYFSSYFDTKYDDIRYMVDRFVTGEDLLMSYVFHDQNIMFDYELIAFQAVNFTHRIQSKYHRPFISNFNVFKAIDSFKTNTGLNSLSLRSSWKRRDILQSIYNLSVEDIEPLRNKWIFVSDDDISVNYIGENDCWKFKDNLKCTSQHYISGDKGQGCMYLILSWGILITLCLMKTRKGFILK